MDRNEAHADQTSRFSNLFLMGNTEATYITHMVRKIWVVQKASAIPSLIFFCLIQLTNNLAREIKTFFPCFSCLLATFCVLDSFKQII